MYSITDFAFKNSRITIVMILMIVVVGILTFLDYPSREDPSIIIRNANVTTVFPGMSSGRIEELITRPIEEKIREIAEIKHIESDSKTGVSLVKITVKDDVNELDPVWRELRDKMSDITSSLPQGTAAPIIHDQIGLTAVATIALWADGFSLSEMKDVAKTLNEKLYTIDGVSKVERYGEQDERIFLDFQKSKITQFEVDLNSIITTLQKQNIILPGGKIEDSGQSIILEPSGNFNSIADIEEVLIPISQTGQVTRLSNLVTIRRGYVDPPEKPVYFNGKPAIILSVSIEDGINSAHFGEAIKARVEALQRELPWGYVLEFATFQPDLVKTSVNGAIINLYQTLVIVLVVVMLFLGMRTGLIVGSFIPITMLMSIIIMRQLDVELQRVSIAAMIISLGMLVDNGIVIAEEIQVRFRNGEEKVKAAINASKNLARPLLTSSLTTILFFVPMALAEGGAGEFTQSLAQVVTIVLLSSWFLSLFLTPFVCVWFMKAPSAAVQSGGAEKSKLQNLISGGYEKILIFVLRIKYAFIALTILALFTAGYAFTLLGTEFFPNGDRNQYLIYLDLPAGTTVKKTDEVVDRLTTWLSDKAENPDVLSNVAYVANGGPRFFLSLASMDPDPHRAFLVVNTTSTEVVDGLVKKTRDFMLNNLPEARGEAKKMWMGSSEAGLFELRLIGPDSVALRNGAEAAVQGLKGMSGIVIAKQDWENPIIKLNIEVDQARARQVGVTSEDVANALNTYYSGSNITDYREGNNVIPVILRSEERERGTLAGLQDLSVYASATGKWLLLEQISEVQGKWETARIKRRDQERTITVTAKHEYLPAVDIYNRLLPKLQKIKLPEGHRWEIGGEVESQSEANEKLFANLPICLVAIVLLLIWQFNSIRRPGIILMTIPLILVGATIGLYAFQALFGFMVILGFFSLAGIIINNGIVLIDRIDLERQAGKAPYDALVTACIARLQPIMITSLTTVLGLLPLIVSQDPLFYAMASAMAFGLAVGTILTLAVVPALYAIFFRISVNDSTPIT